MRIIMLGAPGSGKGTQADFIVQQFSIPKISTGDMLRAAVAAATEIGQQAKAIMAAGGLVSDEIILALVKERVTAEDCSDGFLLDGFPRTIKQAEGLWKIGIDVDHIIEIQVPDEEIIKRLTGRLVHLNSGRTYHIEFNPPKTVGMDDETGEPLVQRDDDKAAVVQERLKTYHEQTAPLTNWYKGSDYPGNGQYYAISGVNRVAAIAAEIAKVFKI